VRAIWSALSPRVAAVHGRPGTLLTEAAGMLALLAPRYVAGDAFVDRVLHSLWEWTSSGAHPPAVAHAAAAALARFGVCNPTSLAFLDEAPHERVVAVLRAPFDDDAASDLPSAVGGSEVGEDYAYAGADDDERSGTAPDAPGGALFVRAFLQCELAMYRQAMNTVISSRHSRALERYAAQLNENYDAVALPTAQRLTLGVAMLFAYRPSSSAAQLVGAEDEERRLRAQVKQMRRVVCALVEDLPLVTPTWMQRVALLQGWAQMMPAVYALQCVVSALDLHLLAADMAAEREVMRLASEGELARAAEALPAAAFEHAAQQLVDLLLPYAVDPAQGRVEQARIALGALCACLPAQAGSVAESALDALLQAVHLDDQASEFALVGGCFGLGLGALGIARGDLSRASAVADLLLLRARHGSRGGAAERLALPDQQWLRFAALYSLGMAARQLDATRRGAAAALLRQCATDPSPLPAAGASLGLAFCAQAQERAGEMDAVLASFELLQSSGADELAALASLSSVALRLLRAGRVTATAVTVVGERLRRAAADSDAGSNFAAAAYAAHMCGTLEAGLSIPAAVYGAAVDSIACRVAECGGASAGSAVALANILGARLLAPLSSSDSFVEHHARISDAILADEKYLQDEVVVRALEALYSALRAGSWYAAAGIGSLSRGIAALRRSRTLNFHNAQPSFAYLPRTSHARRLHERLDALAAQTVGAAPRPENESELACEAAALLWSLTNVRGLPPIDLSPIVRRLLWWRGSDAALARACVAWACSMSAVTHVRDLVLEWLAPATYAAMPLPARLLLLTHLDALLALCPSPVVQDVLSTVCSSRWPGVLQDGAVAEAVGIATLLARLLQRGDPRSLAVVQAAVAQSAAGTPEEAVVASPRARQAYIAMCRAVTRLPPDLADGVLAHQVARGDALLAALLSAVRLPFRAAWPQRMEILAAVARGAGGARAHAAVRCLAAGLGPDPLAIPNTIGDELTDVLDFASAQRAGTLRAVLAYFEALVVRTLVLCGRHPSVAALRAARSDGLSAEESLEALLPAFRSTLESSGASELAGRLARKSAAVLGHLRAAGERGAAGASSVSDREMLCGLLMQLAHS
jgi:hypothetical protein